MKRRKTSSCVDTIITTFDRWNEEKPAIHEYTLILKQFTARGGGGEGRCWRIP